MSWHTNQVQRDCQPWITFAQLHANSAGDTELKAEELWGLQDTKSPAKEKGKQAWACDEGDMDLN